MSRITELVLDESKIPEGKMIFRLGEMTELLIATEDLAIDIKRTHGCNGIFFVAIEEYGIEFR